MLAEIEAGRQPVEVGQEVLRVEDPHDLVHGVLVDRDPRVELLAQLGEDELGLGGDVEAEHVRARHHDLPDQGVFELEHAMDHLALAALHHALARSHVDQRPQLLFRDLGPARLALGADHAEGDRGQGAQPGSDGPQQDREPRHRPVDPRRIVQRVLDRQGHRQHLAEHGEQEDHARDGDAEASGAEDLLGDRGGQRGGPDVDHRDADQQGHQQLVGLGQQRGQRSRMLALLLGQLPEPRAAQREVCGFRAGEHRREQEQHAEPDELRNDPAIHVRYSWKCW